jgi:hypothetical protein
MAWYDGVLSNTVGLAYRAYTGNVDPWTKQQIVDDTAAGIQKASGGTIDLATASAQAEQVVSQTLISSNADPSQASGAPRLPLLGVPGTPEFLAALEKLVYGAIAVGIVVSAFYIYRVYGSTVKRTFARRT